MVETTRYAIYFKTPPHTRALCAKSVDATHAIFRFGAEFKYVTSRL